MGGLLGGLWAFPGGRVEDHEAPSEGLQRFLQDELDISVDVHERIDVIQHSYTHLRITLHAFQCVLVAGNPGGDVYDEIRWVPVGDLPGYAMGKVDRSVARRLK
jgi:A/G-specific adenine glycosylase